MYYYGYGGYGYNNPCYSYQMPYYGYQGTSNGSIILVLFILLVIVIGSRFLSNNI